jgi:hypothetical protein
LPPNINTALDRTGDEEKLARKILKNFARPEKVDREIAVAFSNGEGCGKHRALAQLPGRASRNLG